MIKKLVIAFAMATLPVVSNAALNDLGNGLINDTGLNVTWLQDAGLVKTSCDTNNTLWQAFDPQSVVDGTGRSKASICSDNGQLNWPEANAWIDVLNSQNYLGHNDWRLPSTSQPDATCSATAPGGDGYQFRCEGSELGNLFYVTLANPNNWDSGCSPNCLVNSGPFLSLNRWSYWSGTQFSSDSSHSWYFDFTSGYQDLEPNTGPTTFEVLAVRSGQSLAPVATTTHAIPILGGFGLTFLTLLLAATVGLRFKANGQLDRVLLCLLKLR